MRKDKSSQHSDIPQECRSCKYYDPERLCGRDCVVRRMMGLPEKRRLQNVL